MYWWKHYYYMFVQFVFELTEWKGECVSEKMWKIGLKEIYILELGQFSGVKIASFLTCASDFPTTLTPTPGNFCWFRGVFFTCLTKKEKKKASAKLILREYFLKPFVLCSKHVCTCKAFKIVILTGHNTVL